MVFRPKDSRKAKSIRKKLSFMKDSEGFERFLESFSLLSSGFRSGTKRIFFWQTRESLFRAWISVAEHSRYASVKSFCSKHGESRTFVFPLSHSMSHSPTCHQSFYATLKFMIPPLNLGLRWSSDNHKRERKLGQHR